MKKRIRLIPFFYFVGLKPLLLLLLLLLFVLHKIVPNIYIYTVWPARPISHHDGFDFFCVKKLPGKRIKKPIRACALFFGAFFGFSRFFPPSFDSRIVGASFWVLLEVIRTRTGKGSRSLEPLRNQYANPTVASNQSNLSLIWTQPER